MDLQQRTKRFGIWMILCAVVLRLTAAGLPQALFSRLAQPKLAALMIYLETGRDVRFSASRRTFPDFFRESPPPVLPEPEPEPEPVRPVFSRQEAAEVAMYSSCTKEPDLEELGTRPLTWDLRGQEAAVLILHTHATESYTQEGQTYPESAAYRTLEADYNMLAIGDCVARILEDAGIGVIHDRQLHDHPSYNGSYVHARRSLEDCLQQYPTVQLVLDLHRDASDTDGAQLRTRAVAEGEACAQLMLVVGTNHEHWEENLSLALQLHMQLQRLCPGIMRPVNLRSQRFNQDLSPGALLVEVGAAGNTLAEALLAARILARGILDLAGGTG